MNKHPHALIMKGGGIKGLAFVGALRELQKYIHFDRYVGTSAGAITAIFLGAGYSVDELEALLNETDFKRLLDLNPLFAIYNLCAHGGLCRARTFTKWLDDHLAEKLKSPFRVTLKDLPHRVTVYACRREQDPLQYDKDDPATRCKAAAFVARCSMSIPFFFTPEREEGLNVFDGGMRYNYPVRAALGNEAIPFVGLYLGLKVYQGKIRSNWLCDVWNIWAEAADVAALKEYRQQTIIIDPSPISTLDFSLSAIEKDFLLKAGRAAALDFLLPSHAELSPEADQAKTDAIQARQHVIAFRRAKRKRLLSVFALLLVFAGALRGVWQVIPGQLPNIEKQKKLDLGDLPESLHPLYNKIEADSGQPAPNKGTVIYEVDWKIPQVHPAKQFVINIDAKSYSVNKAAAGVEIGDSNVNKFTCVVNTNCASCKVDISYKRSYFVVALQSPDDNFDANLPLLAFTPSR